MVLTVLSVSIDLDGKEIIPKQFISTVVASEVEEGDDCSFCPDPDEVKMGTVQCDGGQLARCVYGGSDCSVSAQTPAHCN